MASDSLITKLKPEELQEITIAFQEFDANRNGSITPEEMKECLRRSNAPYEEGDVEKVISSMDKNHDGTVSFEEYLNFMAHVFLGQVKQYQPGQTSTTKQRTNKK